MGSSIKRPDIIKYMNRYSKKGLIHVGANAGQERGIYNALGKDILWIEPDPNVFKKLKKNISKFPRQNALCALILDSVEDVSFNISKRTGRSSAFEFTSHHFSDSSFEMDGSKVMSPIRLDSIDISDYDALITDTQGADLNVVKSLGDKIDNFNIIICEVMIKEIYKGIYLEKDINQYMLNKGFKLITNCEYRIKNTQRDNVYVREA